MFYEHKTPNCAKSKLGGTLERTRRSIYILHHYLHMCPLRTVDMKNWTVGSLRAVDMKNLAVGFPIHYSQMYTIDA